MKRRDFIKNTALLTAATGLPLSATAANMPNVGTQSAAPADSQPATRNSKLIDTPPALMNYAEDSMDITFGVSALANGFVTYGEKPDLSDGITVKCPWNAQNGDAIDISSCKDVLIVNNVIDAGDDGICMKGGAGESGVKAGPCENINIQDNTVYHAHGGFVIGSEFSGGMKNILVRNNTFQGTDAGLRFKSAVKRGGKTENIFIDHIYMTDITGDAITFETTYWDNHVGAKQPKNAVQKAEFVPNFQDIHISNVYVRGCKNGIVAHGQEGMIHDITIKDCNIFYNKQAQDIDKACKIQVENVNFSTFAK